MRVNWTALITVVLVLLSLSYCDSTTLTLHRSSPIYPGADLKVVQRRDHARREHLVGNFILSGDVDYSQLYYTKIALGSPPQDFHVQVDTGSDLLWVNSVACTSCPHVSALDIGLDFFNTSSSSTASSVSCSDQCSLCTPETNMCAYSLEYGDGSVASGDIVTDLLHIHPIGGAVHNSSFPVIFGSNTYVSGLLTKSQIAVDGIFGFGKGRDSVVTQLSSRGIIPNVFSHCLGGGITGGGTLVLGEIMHPSMVFTPLNPHWTNYNLHMLSIDVDGNRLLIDPKALTESEGIAVDSGTTMAYLAKDIYEPLITAINLHVSKHVKPQYVDIYLCYQEANSGIEMFPNVTLTFAGNASMILHPGDYLFQHTFVDGSIQLCMGFLEVPNGAISILGELVLRDKIVVYDLYRQQLGWSTHFNCSSSVKVNTTYGFKERSNNPMYKWLIPTIVAIIIFLVISFFVSRYFLK